MSPDERHNPEDLLARARRIAEAAMLASSDERQPIIDSACGDDDALHAEVQRQLLGAETIETGGGHSHDQTVVDDTPRSIPEKIGRYTIRRVIQSGGMGTIYEALQENPRRRVAVKVMRAGLASPSALKRFEYESQILGKLNHPTIAEIYEAGTFDDGTGDAPFFAMEYIEGAKPLDEWARSKRLSARQKLELFVAVCDAIHHGHQKGIVHRDLKPDNILVDSEGRPRVIDFGVARATDSDIQVATMQTDVGQLVGTLYYMSPEQCEADPDLVDTRSDVYALGVILFELLTGRRPHQIENVPVYDAARIIREEAPSRMSTLDRTLGGDLETIVGKALEKDKDRRYQSALELKQDIERFLSNEPIEARPPSLAYQARMFTRRHKALVASVAAIFIVLAGTTIWSLVERGRAQDAASAAQVAEGQARVDRDAALAAEAEIASALATVEAEKQRADDERERAKLVSAFLFEMLGMASPEYAQGRTFTLSQLLAEASGEISESFSDNPLMEIDIRLTLGRIQQEMGDIDAAEPNLQRALILAERKLGTTHVTTRAINLLLAELWIERGRYDEAESRLQSILLAVENDADLDDPQVLQANEQRVTLLMNTMRAPESLKTAEDLVARSRRVLGPDDAMTMRREILLDMTASQASRLSGDSSSIQDGKYSFGSLERISDALGEFHPTTLQARVCEHVRTFALTNRPGSMEDLRDTTEDVHTVLGPLHSSTLSARALLGIFYILDQQHTEAVVELRAAHDGYLAKYGRDHPETMGVASLLGGSLLELGEPKEAEPLLARASYGQEMLWGEDNIRTTQARSIWMMSLMMLDRFEEADPHFMKTVEQVGQLPVSLAEQWLFSIMLSRVDLQIQFEHDVDALVSAEMLRAAIRDREDGNPDLKLASLLGLTEVLANAGHEREAEVTARQLLSLAAELFPDDPENHVRWLSLTMGRLLNLNLQRLALEASERLAPLVRDHELTDKQKARALAQHGRTLMDVGREEEAIPLLEESNTLLVRLHGTEHEFTLGVQSKLSEALATTGRIDEARIRAEATLPRAIALMGADDPRLRNALEHTLAAIAAQDANAAADFFDKIIIACKGDRDCLTEVVALFIACTPPELHEALYPELRATLDDILDSNNPIDAKFLRIACELLLFELELEQSSDTYEEQQAGMHLAYETQQLLQEFDGPGSDELWQELEEVASKIESLIGEEHDRLIALRAQIHAERGNPLAAIEAYRRAAIASSIEDSRRLYLDRANEIQEMLFQEFSDAAE